MPVVVNVLAIPNEENPASAQATEEMEDRYPDIDWKGGVCECESTPSMSLGNGSREGK